MPDESKEKKLLRKIEHYCIEVFNVGGYGWEENEAFYQQGKECVADTILDMMKGEENG